MSDKQRDLRSELRVAMAAIDNMAQDTKRFFEEQHSKRIDICNLLYSIEFELKQQNVEESK